MYTVLTLEGPLLKAQIFPDEDCKILRDAWKRSIAPGVVWLHNQGGGEALVVHREGELTPERGR